MSTDQTSGVPARYAALEPRTRRALAEYMHITTCGPGIYRVESQSGAAYIVDLPSRTDNTSNRSSATCTCPDYKTSTQDDDCKHIRCVKLDIAFGRLPDPEETPDTDDHIEHEPARSTATDGTEATSVATDGGAIESEGSATGEGSSSNRSPNTPETPSSPDGKNAAPETTAQEGIYHRIADRIREIETEIDRQRDELRDLETALSVFEEVSEELDADTEQ